MDFIIVSSSQPPSPPLQLSADRLVLRATKETREREVAEERRRAEEDAKQRKHTHRRHKRHRSSSPALASSAAYGGAGASRRGVLSISGKLLRTLCLAEAREGCGAKAGGSWEQVASQLSCVLLHTVPDVTVQVGMQIVLAADLDDYIFSVQAELLVRGRLVVFTTRDSLAPVAVEQRVRGPRRGQLFAPAAFDSTQAASTRQPPLRGTEPTGPSTSAGAPRAAATDASPREGRPSTSAREATVTTPSQTAATPRQGSSTPSPTVSAVNGSTASSGAGGGWVNKYQRQEPVLDVVAAHTGTEDIRDLNALLETGVLAASAKLLERFLCRQCGRLPVVVLTMSCCGALLCPHCVPSPPAVGNATREERLCPYCTEEPLTPPQSHPQRDSRLAVLVKELKVLYHPQMRALKRRQQQQQQHMDSKRSPDVKSGQSSYLLDASSIGLL